MSSPEMTAFVHGLPKAELHLHLQGAASVPTVLELSRRHPDAGVPTEADELRDFYRFTDFDHFIEVYISVNRLVRTADDVRALVEGLGRDLTAVNVRYAEVTVTPDSHLLMGIDPGDLAAALTHGQAHVLESDRGRARVGLRHPRRAGPAVRPAHDRLGRAPPAAAQRGLRPRRAGVGSAALSVRRRVPTGSRAGPSQRAARRRDHRTRRRSATASSSSAPSASVTASPRPRTGTSWPSSSSRDIVLEVCPTSNIRTRAVATMAEHPFPLLREAGIRVTLNTDDPGMFDTDLNREYLLAHDVFGLGAPELAELARESVRASFASEPTRARLLADIDAYAATVLP